MFQTTNQILIDEIAHTVTIFTASSHWKLKITSAMPPDISSDLPTLLEVFTWEIQSMKPMNRWTSFTALGGLKNTTAPLKK
jgi:hypothetical protein